MKITLNIDGPLGGLLTRSRRSPG